MEMVGKLMADKSKPDIRDILRKTMATNSEIVKTLQCYNQTNVDSLSRCGNILTLLVAGKNHRRR